MRTFLFTKKNRKENLLVLCAFTHALAFNESLAGVAGRTPFPFSSFFPLA